MIAFFAAYAKQMPDSLLETSKRFGIRPLWGEYRLSF
jgi:hypothetical protein